MFTSMSAFMIAFLETCAQTLEPERVFPDWNTLVNWLKDLTNTFNELFATTLKGVPYTTSAFIKRAEKDRAKLIHKLRYNDGDRDVEEVRTGFISVEELPAWLQAKLDSDEKVDITYEIKSELHLTL